MKISDSVRIGDKLYPVTRDATPEEETEMKRISDEEERKEKAAPPTMEELTAAVMELASIIGGM